MVVAGSASTGGLTALVAKKFCRKGDAKFIAHNPSGSILTPGSVAVLRIESGTKQVQEKGKIQ